MNFKKVRYLPIYWLLWNSNKKSSNNKVVDFYCDNLTDYICFKKILKKFPKIRLIAKNQDLQKKLSKLGIESKLYPSYPDVVIMCRHSTWRYPLKRIKKIGMRHGPYHFKDFIKSDYYNEFDLFMFTSPTEARQAMERGINNGVGVGFPKLDDAFDGTISQENLDSLIDKLKLMRDKATIIFSATWSKSNYSAIDKWYDKLGDLADKYNVLVTVHEWTPDKIKETIKNTPGIKYIEDKEILPYLMISDLMIGDISSIIAEFMALNKKVITFKIPVGGRISQEIVQMLEETSYRVENYSQMCATIEYALSHDDVYRDKRAYYNERMFGKLDGKAHARAIKEINKILGQSND